MTFDMVVYCVCFGLEGTLSFYTTIYCQLVYIHQCSNLTGPRAAAAVTL